MLVGGRVRGVSDGTGRVSVGAGVAVGADGMGLGGTLVREGNGEEVEVTLGWSVGAGCGVLVARASTTGVLVGVGVGTGAPGQHWTASKPASPAIVSRIQNRPSRIMDKSQTTPHDKSDPEHSHYTAKS